jgi:hypothetical protein
MPTSTPGRLASLASCALALALAACSGDTALVLTLHTDSDAVATATRLALYVGVGDVTPPAAAPGSVVTPAWWRQAPIELPADALSFPDGFGAQAYELALYPSAELGRGDDLVFAVAAYAPSANGEALIGFAHAAGPVRFATGEIRRLDVPLAPADDRSAYGVTATGCAFWPAEPTDPIASRVRDRAIVPADDADCDGFVAVAAGATAPDCQPDLAIDCDDARPDVFPHDGATAQDCSATDTDCCSQTIADVADNDQDGWKKCAGDCADDVGVRDLFGALVPAAAINPGVDDTTCNGVDESCAIPAGGKCDRSGAGSRRRQVRHLHQPRRRGRRGRHHHLRSLPGPDRLPRDRRGDRHRQRSAGDADHRRRRDPPDGRGHRVRRRRSGLQPAL